MSAGIDELLEAEYAAQQEGAPHIQPVEINEEKATIEDEKLLVDISETLRLLNEQIILLNETTQKLPEMVFVLKTTTEAVQCIANELPAMVREQCLEEYKKILNNAVKNYDQMQKSALKWQQHIEVEQNGRFRLITVSAIVTPILLLLNLIFK